MVGLGAISASSTTTGAIQASGLVLVGAVFAIIEVAERLGKINQTLQQAQQKPEAKKEPDQEEN